MNRKQHFRTHVQGESLENKIQEINANIAADIFIPFILALPTLYFWLIYLGILKVSLFLCLIFSVFFAGAIIWIIVRVKHELSEKKNCRKGLEGERFVGNLLEKLTSDKSFVYHDVVRYRTDKPEKILFNIDHVIVSTKGIFAIDTKNWSLADREYNASDFIFENGELIESTGWVRSDVMNKIDFEAKFLESKISEWIGKKNSSDSRWDFYWCLCHEC